jgi:hypothetical protein
MMALNSYDANVCREARHELDDISRIIDVMDQRHIDIVYLGDLIKGGAGLRLSRATALRIKELLERMQDLREATNERRD